VLTVGHRRAAGQDVFEAGIRTAAPPTATLDHGVENRGGPEWWWHLSFGTEMGFVSKLSAAIPLRIVDRKIDRQLGKIEFENLGRKARLQGPIGAGRFNEAFLQSELDDFGGAYSDANRTAFRLKSDSRPG
jgi:hypothetical protein